MTEPASARPEEPVTVVVRRRAKAGREAELDAWQRAIIGVTSRFPGYQGSTVVRSGRPGPAGAPAEHLLVFRFVTFDDLRRWQTSPERADWLARAEAFTEEVEVIAQQGLEPFFDLPAHRGAPPPRWKMAIVTWVGLYPLIVLVGLATRPLLADIPFALAVAPQSMATVALMAWLVMPFLTRRAAGWLYPATSPGASVGAR
jgi:antibiotic biosynthesis monooxygenase (ABM) superfamily enzyme